MKYVVLIYHNPGSREMFAGLPAGQREAGLAVYRALDESLVESGEMIVSEALADPSAGIRVAVTEGGTVTSDGPFAEAKEHLAGLYLIDCDGPERAVEIAARVPEAAFGVVEVRPVLDLDDLMGD